MWRVEFGACYTRGVLSVVRRFRIREGISTVVQATRAYQRSTRREPGNVRCELWQDASDPLSFTLFDVFSDQYARTQHALMPHTREWQSALAPLVLGSMHEEQAESLVKDAMPPPLPVQQRPAVESSKPFGDALHEVNEAVSQRPRRLPNLVVDLEGIEVAAARDHIPLRAAQPCVVLGAFVITADGVHGLGRTVYRFKPPKSLPGSLVGVQRLLDVPLHHGTLPLNIGIVAVSVEENGGTDVQAVYQTLADAQDLSFWTRTESCPTPRTLLECGSTQSFSNLARRVEVLREERSLSELVRDDTWAGAALGCFELSAARPEYLARFHTAADDRKNDWLMTLRCRIG